MKIFHKAGVAKQIALPLNSLNKVNATGNCVPSGGSAKEIAPPRAILSSQGALAPRDDNIARGGAIPLHSLPRARNYIAFTLFI